MDFKINLSSTYFFIINILFILLSLLMSYFLLRKKNDSSLEGDIDLKFYEKSYLYKGPNFIYNTIIAMILKVYGDGNLEIEKNFYKSKSGEEKISYELKNLNSDALDASEKKLFQILFSFEEDKISTRTLDRLRRTEPDNYNKKFNEFIYFLENEMVYKKLLTKEKKTFKILISFVIFSLLFFIGVISVYNEKFFGAISIILSLVFYASLISSFSKMTALGNKKFKELEKVEEDLCKCKVSKSEDFLLALAFGLKAENLKAIYEKLIFENKINKDYQIFFDSEFYTIFKKALVGDHLLVRN
ncbi:MAG: DUF2207 domain-containing protein [Peptoniphilus harei]|nr:DUF2207 domain-containing protein [Peptoniphilus harei]